MNDVRERESPTAEDYVRRVVGNKTSLEKELAKGAVITVTKRTTKKNREYAKSHYNKYGKEMVKYTKYDTQIPTLSGGFGHI